ncbi:protein kinase [Mesorhizobium sp. AR10]|uniref:serine/threonine-protein kinase n=1 Tax=Mesorhizobium sp. AR10 TaxID=2865839 RepID=UPI00215EFBEA|nr:serine/threonine protein kinase [Mesorhizobium sp. AR10]UVK38465.1 protein kinase [Mesorhizobium sp. AR10]
MSADDKTRILPNLADTTVGTQLSGIYELDERIASGGMGEVYRGHNIQTGDHVAIKIVLPEFARDQTILSLFRKEASILNHLSHDAVVRYHVFTIDTGIGRPYLAMEFVDGESLYDVMRRGAMATQDVRKLCHRLASGLSAVHQAGAIHRDLSPDNIILPGGKVERAKIIDFGIARSATVGGETLIGGKFAGKYNYVSPEQLGLYGGDVSEQSDIYSLGLVLAAALRGKPIDMGGSQFEIVEKRRTVPDLSDIDADFRDIVEAMLQPDPRDRPISMADIARMTRDDSDMEGTLAPASLAPRDRQGLPRTGGTAAPGSKVQPSNVQGHGVPPVTDPGQQRFVPHIRPALLSQPKAPPVAPTRAAPPKKPPATTRNLTIAALTAVVVASGAGLYAAGFLDFGSPPPATDSGTTPPLQPDLSKPTAVDKVAPDNPPAKVVPPAQPQTEPAAENQANAPDNPPAKVAPPAQPPTEPPAENQANATADQKPEPTQPIEAPPPPEKAPEPSAVEAQPPAEEAPRAIQPDRATSDNQKPAPPVEKAVEAPAEKAPAQPAAQPDVVESQPPKQPEPAIPPPEAKATTPEPTAQVPAPQASQPNVENGQGQQTDLPASKPADTVITLNVPKPETPPAGPVDDIAQRVAWVRDFSGGDCFYAAVTSATDKAAAIEGFATAVQPFQQLLGDFQARFHVEPDISVRLIEPTQCEVTNFLRFMSTSAADRPQLELDRTSVPNGSPIGGTLVTRGGLISSVLLIDHKGMAFNLDDRVVAQADKATFSIPIGLGAADRAAGKAVPQIILVITGPRDVQAAAFSTPVRASALLPRILDEIGAEGSGFSATAKYFRLGG